jgi:hypothetical protein
MPEKSQQDEYREEAERLALLPKATRRQVIALHRSLAADKRATRADRKRAALRADDLEKFLGLSSR